MDVTTLKQQITSKTPAMIYLALGTQQVLLQRVREMFINLIPKEERVMNVGSYDMETTPLAVALDDAMAAPFFGERRLVLINKPYFFTGEKGPAKIEHDLDSLSNYLQHPEPSTILVFLAPYEKLDGRKKIVKELKKVAVTVDTAPLDEAHARQQVRAELTSDQYTIDETAIEELVQRTNADYELMNANLSKLKLLTYQDRHITQQAVKELVPQSLDENVFDLVNAVLKHDQPRSIDLYDQLIAGQQPPLRINAVLISQFRLLLQIKILSSRGLSQGSLAQKLKVHPYRVKLGLRTVRQFSLLALENAYLGLVNIEKALKTTQRDPRLLFQLFMLQYGQQQGIGMS
ncbi:DNA polymerase III subunit delta [Limosilactobacillus vaginalis]|uniref:DNA polymerase III subunit delta n=1 Tax=Limosilactobacillus vaginalis TaxID=1633 RepID=UPI0022A9E5EB|nr:DNA polymerase III subunit delta [Limosilactobacillus vaginalis]MCZ2465459.1 DNA polymerase III subunit delta [Limosilactobacillus vaginalis]MDM8259608.1 DNA polymerase III subunit delta [Limosilactobacillus vaginalis]MDM8261456.1 DNA polymerase III subunit delta [Limosilactobacillus vaginalis]MDM8265531.1 DNA polymerase III subunit delta [Limosilactobacillus vaginalis]MDM8304047.1 DNA polymerase III subunit delta [Limosilactobacillus vaginalis]